MKREWNGIGGPLETSREEAKRKARYYAEIQRLNQQRNPGILPDKHDFNARRDMAIKEARTIEKMKMPWYWGPAKFLNDDGLVLVVVALIVGYFAGRLF